MYVRRRRRSSLRTSLGTPRRRPRRLSSLLSQKVVTTISPLLLLTCALSTRIARRPNSRLPRSWRQTPNSSTRQRCPTRPSAWLFRRCAAQRLMCLSPPILNDHYSLLYLDDIAVHLRSIPSSFAPVRPAEAAAGLMSRRSTWLQCGPWTRSRRAGC